MRPARVCLERGGFWDRGAQAVFEQLRQRIGDPATYAGFVAHGVVPA